MGSNVSNREILSIAYPIILGSLAQTVIALTDTIFLGRVSAIAVGASMMAGVYYYIWGTLAWGFAVGLQIMIARRLGEGNLDRIGVIFQHGLLVVLVFAITLVTLMHYVTEPILSSIVQSPAVLKASMDYISYRYIGIFFVCFNYLFRYFYIGISMTKAITYSTIIMAIVNIILDYVLIFGQFGAPEMGISGAALASVIAEVSAMIFFVVYTATCLPLKTYAMTTIHKIEPLLIKFIFKLSMPTMIQKLFSFSTWFLFFIFVEHMGELPIAVSGVMRSVYMLLGIPIFAFGATANTLVSRLIGANREDEIMATLRRIVKISLLSILPIVVICCVFPSQIISIYTNDQQIQVAGVNVIYVLCVGISMMAIAMVYFEAISGAGNTFHALIIEMGVLVLYSLSIWLLVNIFVSNIAGVWISEIVYGSIMAISSILYMRYYPWKNSVMYKGPSVV